MKLKLIHNPHCSKSREALALLRSGGHAVDVLDYLSTPLSPADLASLQQKLGLPARAMLRSGEDEYQALDLARPELSDAEILAAIAAHPRLLQRPIAVQAERALIARPPELLAAWLTQAL